MPHGDIQRADPGLCPKDTPDGAPPCLFCITEGSRGSALSSWRCMVSAEAAFRAADGGNFQEEPQVGGQAQPPGVRHPLTVDQDEVGSVAYTLKEVQQEGDFPKCQEAGNVGEGQLGASVLFLNHPQIRIAQDDDPRPSPRRKPRGRHVGPRHPPHPERTSLLNHFLCQPVL